MSKPSLDQIRGSKAPSVTELVAETRIDTAHPPAAGEHPQGIDLRTIGDDLDIEARSLNEASTLDGGIDFDALAEDEPSASAAAADPDAINRQVGSQARQLAEHLRARQQELDHREAELNARAAQLDRDARAARLWMEEREAALEDTETADATFVVQEEAIRRKAEELSAREQQLAQVDAACTAEREALQKFNEQLSIERQLLEEESRSARERLAAEQVRHAAEIERQRREIEQRGEQVDQARTALEQFREELGRMHRETLEIRLATEELWAELSGSAPPAALTRSLGRIRGQLADHYRLANADLQQKKQELEQLREQLSEQYEKLVRQKRTFDKWSSECRDEVERQAARLQARGDELDRREAEMGEFARAAQAEKLQLQQEVRRLRARMLSQSRAELPAL